MKTWNNFLNNKKVKNELEKIYEFIENQEKIRTIERFPKK